MAFSVLRVAKLAATGIVGMGTSKIVKSAIANNVAIETSRDKFLVQAASIVIGAMAAAATQKYTEDQIDETVEKIGNIVKEFKEASKLDRINDEKSTFTDEGLDPVDFVQQEGKWVRRPKTITEEERQKELIEIFMNAAKQAGVITFTPEAE